MAGLTREQTELVALGASLGSNCLPCIAFHIREAQKCGLSSDQIKEALAVADKVRQIPASLVRSTAYAQLDGASPNREKDSGSGAGGCGCGDAADC